MCAAAKNNRFEARILREMRERAIKSFMDVITMTELRSGKLSGARRNLNQNAKFNLLVRSGSVNPLLYSLERNG